MSIHLCPPGVNTAAASAQGFSSLATESGLDAATYLLLAEKHASVKHVRLVVVKGNDVFLLDQVELAKVERDPRHTRHISQSDC